MPKKPNNNVSTSADILDPILDAILDQTHVSVMHDYENLRRVRETASHEYKIPLNENAITAAFDKLIKALTYLTQ